MTKENNKNEEPTLVESMPRRNYFIAMLDNDIDALHREILIIKADAFDKICDGRDPILTQKLAIEEINSLCADFFFELKGNINKMFSED